MRTWRFIYVPLKLDFHIREGEDGFFVASCPALKGCHTQGQTLHECLENIEDAILGYLDLRSPQELFRLNQDMPQFIAQIERMSFSLSRASVTEGTSSTLAHPVWTRGGRERQAVSAMQLPEHQFTSSR